MLNATDATQVSFLGEFISRGRRWNAYSDGTVLPFIAGGNGEGEGGEGAGGGTGGEGGKPAADAITQEQLNAAVARTKRETAAATQQAVADALGVSVDEAKTIIAERKASDDAQKTEAQKAADAATKDRAEAERIKAEAATERHHARLERALSKAGLDVDNTALLRAGLAAIDVATDADADTVKAAVEKLKTDAPALFGTATTNGGGTHSDTGGQGGGGQRKKDVPAGDFGKDGAAEAARRFPVKDKQPA